MRRIESKRRLDVFGASLVLMGVLWAGCGAEARPPNIFLITADALRFDHLSSSSYARATSPNIDTFAKSAVNFTNAFAVIPKTGPSFTSLFTGLSPETHGVKHNEVSVPANVTLLAEYLRRAGYETAAFVSNPVLQPEMGYARGFETYVVVDDVESVNRSYLNWANRALKRPLFVWLHYIDPHGPYQPPEELTRLFEDDAIASRDRRMVHQADRILRFRKNKGLGTIPEYQRLGDHHEVAYYVSRYDAEIRHVDGAFEAIISGIKDRGLYGGSLIIFSSDHGESLGEHDFYFEHGWFAYEASLHIPLLVKGPGMERGRSVAAPVSTLDILPTILSAAGVQTGPRVDGVDLTGPVPDERAVLIENSDKYPWKINGIRTRNWKYLRRSDRAGEELFDLAEDPGEIRNLADAGGDRLRELRRVFESELTEARVGADRMVRAPRVEPTRETRERLRALGYAE